MSPPGKNSGETTWQSVAITMRPVGRAAAAPGRCAARSHSLSKAAANSSSISCAIARPPPPCVMSTRPCFEVERPDVAALDRHAVATSGIVAEAPVACSTPRRRLRTTPCTSRSGSPACTPCRTACSRAGFFTPRRMAPHSQALLSGTDLVVEREALLGVEGGEGLADAQRAVRHLAQAAPFEAAAQLEHLGHQRLRLQVAVARDGAGEFVLHLGAALVDLAHQHQDRLHHVQRLEAGDDHRLAVFLGEELVGPAADDGGHMRRADEAVERQRAQLRALRAIRGCA